MRLSQLSLEELETLEQTLHENEPKSEYGHYSMLVNIYEEMYRRLVPLARKDKEQYGNSGNYIKKLLISSLIKYGTYLKMNNEKDDKLAQSSLERALKYDKTIPIVYYRLGFLAYKEQQYSRAVQYFQSALVYQCSSINLAYQLNDQQHLHAHLYLTNSALYVASSTHQALEQLDHSHSQLPNLELSPLYAVLKHNENYLEANAFYQVSKEGIVSCSRESCDELAEQSPKNTIILYFNDQQNILIFNGKEKVMTPNQAAMLRHFLLCSNQDNPGTRENLVDFFGKTGVDGLVKKANLVKAIERLRTKLGAVGIPSIIEATRYQDDIAYFFNQSVPYIVMFRVDDAYGSEYIN